MPDHQHHMDKVIADLNLNLVKAFDDSEMDLLTTETHEAVDAHIKGMSDEDVINLVWTATSMPENVGVLDYDYESPAHLIRAVAEFFICDEIARVAKKTLVP